MVMGQKTWVDQKGENKKKWVLQVTKKGGEKTVVGVGGIKAK